jgi:hypothetical protein
MLRNYRHLWIIVLAFIISVAFFNKYARQIFIFHGDAFGYYEYLPSAFIYHNLRTMEVVPTDKGIPDRILSSFESIKSTGYRTPKGYIVDQYTYGVAFMELPFFLVAHIYDKLTGKAADGWSDDYAVAIRIASFLYALLGLFIIYNILKIYFDRLIALITVLLIYLSTHFFWFSVYQAGMSHMPLFFLYALLMFITIKLHERPRASAFIIIGFIMGLITITRPSDAVCIFIPLLYNVYSKQKIREKIAFILSNIKNVLLLIIAFIIPIIPQLLYWKAVSGKFLFYSYGNQKFDWLKPHLLYGLFSFSNGWLPYAPIMVFAILGLLLYKRYMAWIYAIFIILPVYIYIIYSWYCYNYINGMGSRPMIHMYPLLALPLAALIQFISQKKFYLKAIFALLCCFFIATNISFSSLKVEGLLNTENANMQYSLHMLFRNSITYNDLVLADIGEFQPDEKNLTKIATLKCLNFDDSLSDHYIRNGLPDSKYVYRFVPGQEFQDEKLKIVYSKAVFKDAVWLKCSGRFLFRLWPSSHWHALVVNFSRGDKSLKWVGCGIDNKIGLAGRTGVLDGVKLDHFEYLKWAPVYFFTKIPRNIRDGDTIEMNIWDITKDGMDVDDLCIELYK